MVVAFRVSLTPLHRIQSAYPMPWRQIDAMLCMMTVMYAILCEMTVRDAKISEMTVYDDL